MLAGLFSRFTKSNISNYDRLLKQQLDELESSSFKPCFTSEDARLYLRAVELNEFNSFSVLLTGPIPINTTEGCVLKFYSANGEMVRKSDSDIVKGEFSNPYNIGVTSFDIDLDEELLNFIRTNSILGVKFETKNGKIRKEMLQIDFTNVDDATLIASLDYKEPDEEDIIFEEILSDEIGSEEE